MSERRTGGAAIVKVCLLGCQPGKSWSMFICGRGKLSFKHYDQDKVFLSPARGKKCRRSSQADRDFMFRAWSLRSLYATLPVETPWTTCNSRLRRSGGFGKLCRDLEVSLRRNPESRAHNEH